MYLYAKLGIIFEIDNYFYSFFQKSAKKFGSLIILPYLCCINLLRIMAKYNIQPKKREVSKISNLAE